MTVRAPPLPRQSRLPLTPFQIIFHPFRSRFHPLVACTCCCISVLLSHHDCCIALSSFKDKCANRRGPSCMSGYGGQIFYRSLPGCCLYSSLFQPLQLISTTSLLSHAFWCLALSLSQNLYLKRVVCKQTGICFFLIQFEI